MSIDLNHLSAKAEKEDVDFDNLPEQMGGFQDPPQPGSYRFETPKSFTGANFEEYEDEGRKYLRVKFDQNAPLRIVQSVNPDYTDTPFTTRLSNEPRRRGKGEDAPKASDLDYYIKAVKHEGARPASNKAWAQAIIASGGKQWGADIEFSWVCNPNKNIYSVNDAGTAVEVEGQKGCGAKYYQRDIAKVEGKFPVRIECSCGAQVRAFANLTRFRE